MSNNNPSINPADNGTLAGAITFSFQKMLQNVNGMLPAQVISYDRDTNRAQVQLLINIVGTDGSQYPRPQLAAIPVFVAGGGGFRISFPLKAGDQGWVIANDRDISNFLNSYNQTSPNTARIKNFSDGVFYPDTMKGLNTIDSDDAENLVIQNNAGTVTISISNEVVTITAPKLNIAMPTLGSFINIQGTINISGTVNEGVPYNPDS
jgi:hypothetical protein